MKRFLFCALPFIVAGCVTTTPPTNVHQPMTVRPEIRPDVAVPGSIFQAGFSRTLFEDRRARYIGDTMTIVITETTAASAQSNTKTNRAGSINAQVGPIVGLPGKSFQGMEIGAGTGSNVAFDGGGGAAANNAFTGNIAVTIIEVLPNGNLLVSGEKQIAIGRSTEHIRLSGIVNPRFISAANTINSSNVADARIEYRANGVINEAQSMGWLSRFFMTFLPF